MTTTLAPPNWPVHPATGFPALGLLDDGRPVWPAIGAAEDDDGDTGMDLENPTGGKGKKPPKVGMDLGDDDDQDTDEDTEDDAGDEEDGEEWKPPTREEYDALVAERDAAKRVAAKAATEAREGRKKLREARRQQTTAERRAETSSAETDEAAAQRAADAVAAAEEKYKLVAVRSAAIAELMKAEFRNPTDQRLTRMIGRLNMAELDVDPDTGKVEGLEDQVEDLRDEFPELFGKDEPKPEPEPSRRRPAAPRITGADRRSSPPEPKTTGEKIAARVLRGA